jgi:hypothetical protein
MTETLNTNFFPDPPALVLTSHAYIPSQSGTYSVTAYARPVNAVDTDPDLSNNTFVSTYEVLPGTTNVTCSYDSMTQTVVCQLTNAPPGAMYDVHAEELGTVDAPAFVGTMVGPQDDVSAAVACNAQGRGAVTIRVLQGQTEILETPFCFDCAGIAAQPVLVSCGVVGEPVPSTRSWGLGMLAAFLCAAGALTVRRVRRA